MRALDVLGIVVLVGGVIAYVAHDKISTEHEAEAARTAGFASVSEYKAAKAAGYSDPAQWSEERQRQIAAQAKKDQEQYERTRNPATKMLVKNLSWSKSGFGTVALVTLTIENKNDFPVKDVAIGCSFSANSGTQLGNAGGTIYETIKANSSRTFKEFNIGFIHSQAQRGGCSVDSARRL